MSINRAAIVLNFSWPGGRREDVCLTLRRGLQDASTCNMEIDFNEREGVTSTMRGYLVLCFSRV